MTIEIVVSLWLSQANVYFWHQVFVYLREQDYLHIILSDSELTFHELKNILL